MFDNASDNIRLDKRNYGIDLLRLVSIVSYSSSSFA